MAAKYTDEVLKYVAAAKAGTTVRGGERSEENIAAIAKLTAASLAAKQAGLSGAVTKKQQQEFYQPIKVSTSGTSEGKYSNPQTAREEQFALKKAPETAKQKKDRTQKQLEDYQRNTEIDWTDTNQRKQYDAELKQLQAAVDAAGSELARRDDMAEINAMPDEDREQLRQYIEDRDINNEVTGRDNLVLGLVRGINLDKSKNALSKKYGEEKVDQLASTYSRYLKEKQAKQVEADTRSAVQENPWKQQIPGAVSRLLGGPQATADRFAEMFSRDRRYSALAPYVAGDLISLQGNTVTGETARILSGDQYDETGKKIRDGGILRQGAAYLYQGGMSMIDSFMRTAAGGGAAGGAALAACNAFSQTVAQSSQQGASPDEAYKLGVAVAGIEYLSEKIPVDEVFKLAKGGKVNVLKQAFKQTGIEISTEELSLIGSMAAEAAILREKSSYKQQIGDLVANGASYEEAKAQADKSVLEEVKQTALVSGFAGFLSGGGAAIVGNLATNNAPEVTAEVPQEVPTEVAPAAPVVDEGQQIMEAVAAELPQQAPQQEAAPAVEAQTTQTTEQAAQAPQQPQEAPRTKQSTVIDSVVETIQRNGGNVTNRMAENVLNDTAAKQQLFEQIGMEISGSKSQQRQIVKDALSQMAASQDTQAETAQNPPTAEPMQATETSEQATKQASAPTADMQMGASNQSAEGGQIKGTGAAEQNFSEKPSYNATLSEDNAQPDRRNDVRPMELPATDVNGGNISATTANVYGSQNTPDDLAAAMEEPVARGDFSYVRITNDEATQRAQQTIGNAGSWETARDNFRMDVDRGNAGAELSARGALILNHAAEVYQQAKDSGDVQAAERAKREWLTILSDVQKLGTNTAQGLQALKIIRNLMPKDKIQFTRIAVQNMVRDMRLNTDIQIDEQLLTDYENATTDQQRDEIMEKIQQNVADQIPTTWLDKWNALRYTNMLGNLKTNVRNVAGNVANTFIYRFKDGTGAAVEAIVNKATKGKTGRTKSFIVDKRIEKACADYYQQVKNAINDGGKYSENTASGDFAQGVMDKRQIFKFKPLEGYRKATNWMMNNQYFGDEAFGKASFTHAMAGYLQANGVKNAADIQKASPDLIDKAVAYAVKEAQETTFKDNTALANVLGKIKKDAGIVGEGLMPLTKTPANVLVRAEEYSPLGILNTAIMGAQKLAGNTKLADSNGKLGTWAQNGQDITGTDIINSLSKSLTGSAVFALGAILKSQGILNGGPDDDEEQAAFDKMNGIQPYSINMPDGTTYTLDWLTPVAMPLFMGAQLMQIASEKDLTFADLEQVLTSIADPMIQMSMMQGINSSLEDIKYSGNNMGQFFLNASVNYLTQGLTNTLLGQIERSTEENRQTTYINPDSQTPQWIQKALSKASQKVPGWDYQQTDYVDAWGQKQKNEGGLLYNLLSPGYSSEKKSDAVTQELNRLRQATGETIFPETASKTISYIDKDGNGHDDVRLTEEQYQTLAETQGQTARKLVEDMIQSKAYQALTDEQKAEAIDAAYLYARKTGEIAAIGESHTGYDQSWMYDVNKGGGANELMRRVFNSSLNTSMSDLDNAWEKGYNEETFSRDMAEAYDSYKKAPASMRGDIYAEATGTAKRYMEARDKGLTHKEVIAAIENVVKVHGTGAVNKETGKPTVRDIDRRKAIASTPGLSESAKDILMKAYMADYDPSDESPETTEFKYDYARKEMGLSATEYADTYKAYLDSSKRRDKIAAIRALGYDYGTALALYNLYNGRKKNELIKLYG